VTALRAKLEAMATEKEQTILEDGSSEVPPNHELFSGDAHEQPSENELFANSAQLQDTPTSCLKRFSSLLHFIPTSFFKRFSNLQKGLIVSIALIGAMLLYALLNTTSQTVTSGVQTPIGKNPVNSATTDRKETYSLKQPTARLTQQGQEYTQLHLETPEAPDQIVTVEPVLSPSQPVSLKVAQDFFLNQDYPNAYVVYNQLYQSLTASQEQQLLRDFLQLQMALCMQKAVRQSGQSAAADAADQAYQLFRKVSQSRCPVVRAVANYHLSLIEVEKKQYLKAQIRAYQTIALIDAVDLDRNWVLSLQRDCQFLAAECLTRYVLSLCDADKNLPEDLWSNFSIQKEPFNNLNESQLRALLDTGSKKLSEGLLGPQIKKLKYKTDIPRWSVICCGAPIEELLARFASNADLDVSWIPTKTSGLQETADTVQNSFLQDDEKWDPRKRPVSLYLPDTTTQQFITVAAGCVGLLARLDDNSGTPAVKIIDPAKYSSLSNHISSLSKEALCLWQRFLLTFQDDKRIANVHFAMGLLYAQQGQIAEATAEYKLVANRFWQSSSAPFALLHSSRLKADIHDYLGAREDLKQLIEQYHDSEIANQACLHLADVTMKAGFETEAELFYRKVYNLGLSYESQSAAAMGAARCLYEKKDYENSAKWLNLYINLAKDSKSSDLYLAYLLLGKTYMALGKTQQSCEALRCALAGELPKEEYVETISALVNGYMEQEDFVAAFDLLENAHSATFSEKESTEILLLRSKLMRTMGLVDKAIAAIGDKEEFTSDSQLKAKISFELSKCHIAKGNLEQAHKNLTEILTCVEAGPLAHEIAIELADVCLKIGQNAQTISVCQQVLNLGPSAQIEQKAMNIMATAYKRQKNYDKAASALLGRRNDNEISNEKGRSSNSANTEKPSFAANAIKPGQLTQ